MGLGWDEQPNNICLSFSLSQTCYVIGKSISWSLHSRGNMLFRCDHLTNQTTISGLVNKINFPTLFSFRTATRFIDLLNVNHMILDFAQCVKSGNVIRCKYRKQKTAYFNLSGRGPMSFWAKFSGCQL